MIWHDDEQCLRCGGSLAGRFGFVIVRETRDGQRSETGRCCSLPCALRWTLRDAQRVPGYRETYHDARFYRAPSV